MDLERELSERFGLSAFRPWQREAIEALLRPPGRVLVVAPTGGGKSLTYQFPAAVLPGVTLVLSPLVALMEDQVRSLTARGVPATFLASTLDGAERNRRESELARGAYKLLYAAPERLGNEWFLGLLGRLDLALVAVDDAHCIAQWGHDFRPDYLRIGALLRRLNPPRVLACTATATPRVRKEIREQLGLDGAGCQEVLRGFARPNLHLSGHTTDGPKETKHALLAALTKALGSTRKPNGGAIVYGATRKSTEVYGAMLAEQGYRASVYHAGLDADVRTRVARRFADSDVDVIVATNAFGMGIDRPDIRAVVHVQPPSSIEAYYQEVGRAGRDGDEAHGLLLCSGADIALRRRMVNIGPDGGAAPAEQAARGWALFRDLLRYLDARTCRHDFVLRYFGDEQELLGGCGHCDICENLDALSEGDESSEETTLLVRKALSAVARAQRRAGLTAIVDMLRGLDTERTRRFGFTDLSTFGLLKGQSNDGLVALFRCMLAAGWIDLTPTDHPVPFVTRVGGEVMRGNGAVRLLLPPVATAGKKRGGGTSGERRAGARPAAEMLDTDEARALFERLRAHRAEVARTRKVPPYVVAFDRTLVDMARSRPRTRTELLGVHGMGPARVEQYGDGFLRILEN